jgi:DNA-directed RNA polymerase specialized sigma24 family protein
MTLMNLPKLPRILRTQPAPHNAEGLALDCDLAAKIREGDKGALQRLVERHIPRVNRYVHHRLGPGHGHLAPDIVSDTFVEAMSRLGPYARSTTSTPMEFWLLRLAERNLGKRRLPAKGSDQDKATPTTSKEGEELALVRSAMTTLHRRHAYPLALALFEGMSAEEIAYTLGVGQARAMRRLRAALRQMGKRLAGATGGDR